MDRDEVNKEEASKLSLAGLIPWLCSYDGPDGRYSITLYGTDPQQVAQDNAADLPGLCVDGVLHATISAGKGGLP